MTNQPPLNVIKHILFYYRQYWTALIQVFFVLSAFGLAYSFRFDLNVPDPFFNRFLALLPALLVIKLTIFWRMGLFQGWWRYVSMADLIVIGKANLFASSVLVMYAALVHRLADIPRSVLVLDGIFCFLLMGGVRFVTRAFRENYFPMPYRSHAQFTRMLVVGAGDAGRMIAREIRQNPQLQVEIVGFVDDDPRKKKVKIHGYPVLGKQKRIAKICQEKMVDEVVIAIPSASGKQIREIVNRCVEAGVKSRTLPGVSELIDGRVSVQHIKDVEVVDLLGREPVRLDVDKIKAYVEGKRVLVTGAGGSIGSEICRQVARFSPAKIVLFDNAETPLFHIERELFNKYPDLHISAIIGDVRARSRVEGVFDEFLPQVVFHAAAYKHVPLMEKNPAAAARNNIYGSKVVADAADAFGVLHFVMISTDKAVNPTNVMGATKRAAELYVQALARKSRTSFVTVRFGNVLGSNGSVIPIFKEQIRAGGPVTVTDPEVTRFFMTIPEASQLVLQAGSMGKGGEIFLLDMGEPVKIVDLAEELIRLSGLKPYEDIDIVFSGLRPGEKLYEELLLDGEGVTATSHEKICVAKSREVDSVLLNRQLESLLESARAMDLDRVIAMLQEMVPEYRPAQKPCTGKILYHPAARASAAGGQQPQ